jgi:hypothetical protein
MNTYNPMTDSINLIHMKRMTKGGLGRHVMKTITADTILNKQEYSDKDFVAHMKVNPDSWGRTSYRGHTISKGHVEIYFRDGSYSKSYYFHSYAEKLATVTKALKEIKNLHNCYIIIKHN